MGNIDEQFKDSSPVDTVKRIKSILAENGLSVTEDWGENVVKNCYSIRATIDNTRFGTNGKGVTRELANASAHAELMERLQSGIMGRDSLNYPDAESMNSKELLENCCSFLTRICSVVEKFEHISYTPEQLVEFCMGYEGGKEYTKALPFYSVTEDKMTYVPECLLMPLFSSTGNCAGNTAEEAIVQGLSEIIERWFQRHFLCLDVVPPTIPDTYLQNFARAYETITDIKSKGYDVIIKDCSMGSGYPVIATAIIDRKKHAYHVHLGASPVFEIALGRSLTETFQGRLLESVADTKLSESAKHDVSTYRKAYQHGRGAYPIEFFTDDSSYPFVPFPDRTGLDNKALLQYAVEFIKSRNMHMYIRDVSHLGFHSYKIIVPDMCKSEFDMLTSNMGVSALDGDTRDTELNLLNATEDKLFELQLWNMYRLNNYLVDSDPRCFALMRLPVAETTSKDRAIGYAHLAYVDWQCGNHRQAMNYAKNIQKQNVSGISDFCSCLLMAKSMLEMNNVQEQIQKCLSIFYDEETIVEVLGVLTQGKNPFAKYVVRCGQVNGCAECAYVNGCCVKQQGELMNLVNRHIKNFDISGAFSKLKTLFQSL